MIETKLIYEQIEYENWAIRQWKRINGLNGGIYEHKKIVLPAEMRELEEIAYTALVRRKGCLAHIPPYVLRTTHKGVCLKCGADCIQDKEGQLTNYVDGEKTRTPIKFIELPIYYRNGIDNYDKLQSYQAYDEDRYGKAFDEMIEELTKVKCYMKKIR